MRRLSLLLTLGAGLTLAACDDTPPQSEPVDARVGAPLDRGAGGAGGMGGAGGAQGQGELTVTEPADGAVQSPLSLRVAGTYTGPGDVSINGRPAQRSGDTFELTLDLPGEGAHVLTTTAGEHTDRRTVIIDQAPPRIDFRAPARAAHLTDDTVDLELTATDGQTRVQTLSVRGIELDPAAGPDHRLARQALEPGVNLFTATATDAAANPIREHAAVLHGPLRDPDEPVAGALRLHLGPAAINALERLAVRLIGEQDLATLLPNPLLENPARISVTDARWADLTVDLEPVAGQLNLLVQFERVNVTVQIAVGQAPALPANIGIERITLRGALIPRIVDGRLTADIPQDRLTVELVDLNLSLDQIDDFGDPDQEASLIEQIISAALTFAISEQLPGALDGLLGRLDQPFDFTVLGATLRLALRPEVLVVNAAGLGVRIGVAVTLDGPPAPPSAIAGYLTTPSGWTGVPTTEHLGLAVDDDLLNAVLYQLWRSGALLPTIDDAFIEAGGAQLSLVRNLLRSIARDADPTVTNQTPIAAETRLPLPIAVTLRKSAQDRIGLRLGIAGLELALRTDDAAPRPLLSGSATLLVEGDLAVDARPGGVFGLNLELDRFTTAFDVLDEPLRGTREAAIEARTGTLLDAIGTLLPGLLSDLELPAIDLVEFGEITVGVAPQDPNFLILDAQILP